MKKKKALIVIDCGHGKTGDRGAKCADGRMENDLNLIITNKLAAALSAAGHEVITIGNDSTEVFNRGKVGSDKNCDLMLSIHHNAYGEGANGTIVYKSVFADKECPEIAALAKNIQTAISKALGTKSRNGGVPGIRWNSKNNADYYGVIRGNSKHNTLIIESLFCDNAKDLARWNPDKIVAAVTDCVCDLFGTPNAGNEKDGVKYRVQIGAYKEKALAEAQLAKAKAAGFSDAFIVANGEEKSAEATKPIEEVKAPKKTNEELAKEVINGDWGNGAERKKRLTDAGYNYSDIQKIVNQMLK